MTFADKISHGDEAGCPRIIWETRLHPIGPDNDPFARLRGEVEILGVPFHVNAEATIDYDLDGGQNSVLALDETFVRQIQVLVGDKGREVVIGGRAYLLVIFPFSR